MYMWCAYEHAQRRHTLHEDVYEYSQPLLSANEIRVYILLRTG